MRPAAEKPASGSQLALLLSGDHENGFTMFSWTQRKLPHRSVVRQVPLWSCVFGVIANRSQPVRRGRHTSLWPL